MIGIGEALKIIRREKRVTLKDISQKTNISIQCLQALEEENFREIPGKFHLLNYLKGYLNALKIEENGFLELYKDYINKIPFKKEAPEEEYLSKLKYYRFKKRKALPLLIILLIILTILVCILVLNPFNISWGEIFNGEI